ncbi:carboxypeptidase regulatory-like domain-containing protein [bacterium]|nr:carboxypeptidase regulatory-like domain-containing protein [bacterium]
MNRCLRIFLPFIFILFSFGVNAQIATKTGNIYGKIIDQNGGILPGVSIELECGVMPPISAVSGAAGAFRFTNLPPEMYTATFHLDGFTEVKQEQIRVVVGGHVQLQIIMKPVVAEEITVVADSPLLDRTSAGNNTSYSREYLDQIPSSRDPWYIIDLTPGIDSDRFNVAALESGNQNVFFARGDRFRNNGWNYDGLNIGAQYYDFDAFEEIQISTGGNDASIKTGGVAINIVTKRGGNQWAANASYYFISEALQSTNTPQELLDNPIINPETGKPAEGSNRIHKVYEYGLDIGGPLIKDRLFLWSAFRNNDIDQFTIQDVADSTTLRDYNFKLNAHWNQDHESQFSYFLPEKYKSGRVYFPGQQSPETLVDQGPSDNVLHGVWSLQHTWIPNDHTLISARYGYIGNDFEFVPRGGSDVPMIFLAAIPQWESTIFGGPVTNPTHNLILEGNSFKENFLGGDHELKFGFEYSTTTSHTFSSYGNGVFIYDLYQTVSHGPLTSGVVFAQHAVDGRSTFHGTSFYVSDTYRKDRLTLSLGARFDYRTGENLPSHIEAVPGFEQLVGAFDYPGGDPGIVLSDFSPRIGATYDLTGDGKTLLRGNYARYYEVFDNFSVLYSNPTYTFNGARFFYSNLNGDREITPDELVSPPSYYGGLTRGGFDLDAFLDKHRTDPDLSNAWIDEWIAGVEREVAKDLSVGLNYTYRRYGNFQFNIPVGVTTEDYLPAGTLEFDTTLGHFEVPYFRLRFVHDGVGVYTNIRDYRQTYHGLDITLRKRMSKNFLLNGSLTLQRQTAHYNGGDSLARPTGAGGFPGRPFQFDPTNLPFLDGQSFWAFDRLAPTFPTFAEWYLKMSGVYLLPWNISLGANMRFQQGYPYVLSAVILDPTFAAYQGSPFRRILVEPFGSRLYDNKFILDFRIEKGIQMKDYGRIGLILDIFNLTNEGTVLSRNRDINRRNFNKIQQVLSPRAARLGVRYSF